MESFVISLHYCHMKQAPLIDRMVNNEETSHYGLNMTDLMGFLRAITKTAVWREIFSPCWYMYRTKWARNETDLTKR